MNEITSNLTVDILEDEGKLKSNVVGFHTCVYPQFEINHNEKMKKSLTAWETIVVSSAEFTMSISIKKNGKFLELEWRMFEFLSNHRINIIRKVKIPEDFSFENFGDERKSFEIVAGDMSLHFEVKKGTRRLRASINEQSIGKCDLDITVINGNTRSFASVNGFSDEEKFLVVENRLAMQTSGFAKFGAMSFYFTTKKNLASLSYGRGVLPQKTKVLQSMTAGEIDSKPFGLTIYNDDNSINASTFFYDGILHNLQRLKIEIDHENPMDPWKISSLDKSFKITVMPFEEKVETKKFLFKVLSVEKRYNALIEGSVTLDDGSIVEIKNLVSEFLLVETF